MDFISKSSQSLEKMLWNIPNICKYKTIANDTKVRIDDDKSTRL